jgi:hypothetical protein
MHGHKAPILETGEIALSRAGIHEGGAKSLASVLRAHPTRIREATILLLEGSPLSRHDNMAPPWRRRMSDARIARISEWLLFIIGLFQLSHGAMRGAILSCAEASKIALTQPTCLSPSAREIRV